jgi:hypothetical protein
MLVSGHLRQRKGYHGFRHFNVYGTFIPVDREICIGVKEEIARACQTPTFSHIGESMMMRNALKSLTLDV